MTPSDQRKDKSARIYPCRHDGCRVLRSENEGGKIFTVCDKHWDEEVQKCLMERYKHDGILRSERDQRLTDHLAEKVCGLSRDEWWQAYRYCMVDGREFDPIHDPRDCDIVKRAWQQSGGWLKITGESDGSWGVRVSRDGGRMSADAVGVTESKAVCEAIADASGYVRKGE